MENKYLNLRMYFFVPYNISPIQQAIQAGHAMGRYIASHGQKDPNHIVWNFLRNHETWIILNGGTTNNTMDGDSYVGTLNQIELALVANKIEHEVFHETDLNDALTAVCFIADERVWNYEDYPNFVHYLLDIKMYPDAREAMPAEKVVWIKTRSQEELQGLFPEWYTEWIEFMGGEKNVFLRELITDKRLA